MSLSIIQQAIPLVITGMWLTLLITLGAFVLGQILALPIGLARASKSPLLRVPAFVFTGLIRGSPLIVQLFIFYFGLSQIAMVRESVAWVILREPLYCAIAAVGINSSAYMAELISGAVKDVPSGQVEAAHALGLPRHQMLISVMLPQVYRNLLPVLGNEMTLVMKASSLASAVTVMEMTGIARTFVARTYAPFEVFAVAGCLYLAIGIGLGLIFKGLEHRFAIPGGMASGLR